MRAVSVTVVLVALAAAVVLTAATNPVMAVIMAATVALLPLAIGTVPVALVAGQLHTNLGKAVLLFIRAAAVAAVMAAVLRQGESVELVAVVPVAMVTQPAQTVQRTLAVVAAATDMLEPLLAPAAAASS